MWKSRTFKNHFLLDNLQREYGDFVRTGRVALGAGWSSGIQAELTSNVPLSDPSEITVFHPGIFMAVDGPSSKCTKGEWYDLLYPDKSLVTSREKKIHGARRRHWNRGFSSRGASFLSH